MNLSINFEKDNMYSRIELFDTLSVYHTLTGFIKRFLTNAELLELSPYISEEVKAKGTSPQEKVIEVQGNTILPIFCTARLFELKELSNGEGIDDGCIGRLILGSALVDYIFGDKLTRDINVQVTGSAVKIYGTLTSENAVALTIRTKERCKHISFEAEYGQLGDSEHSEARVELVYCRISSFFSEDFKSYIGKIFSDSEHTSYVKTGYIPKDSTFYIGRISRDLGHTSAYIRTKYISAQVDIRKVEKGL